MNIGYIDPIGAEMRERAKLIAEQEIERDNALYEIKQNTDAMNRRIEDANERILLQINNLIPQMTSFVRPATNVIRSISNSLRIRRSRRNAVMKLLFYQLPQLSLL